MSSDLSQNNKYTIISGGGTTTLFWHDYMDQPGINAWFYIQHRWWFGGHRAVERLYYAAVSPNMDSAIMTISR